MKLNDNFFLAYVRQAPVALAIERSLECHILAGQRFEPPVLDLGCGEGMFAAVLFAEPVDTGLDLNARELEAARAYGIHRELIQAPASRIPKPDGFYRTIFSNSVLEHIPDLTPVLREARRVLADGGHFYATVPTNYFDHYSLGNLVLTGLGLPGAAARFRGFYNRFWKHYHFYPIDRWKALFTQCGFEVRQVIPYCPKPVALLNDLLTWTALPAMVVKKLCNRWFLIKRLRHYTALALVRLLPLDFGIRSDLPNGGIVFFDLVKDNR